MIQVESPKTENPSVCNRKFLSVYICCFSVKAISERKLHNKNCKNVAFLTCALRKAWDEINPYESVMSALPRLTKSRLYSRMEEGKLNIFLAIYS